MQRLERILSNNMAALAIISSIMLGLGQMDLKPPLLIIAGSIAAVVYTDRRKVFALNNLAANIAALIAVGIALIDFSASDRNQQLLAIANLLVYLQVVVFFQEKNARIFGQLAMLSLLQVVVAAALNYSILFGFLVLGYMFLGLPTLCLFFYYRELGNFVPSKVPSAPGETVLNAGPSMERNGAHSGPAPETETTSSNGHGRKRRWPLTGQVPAFVGADFHESEDTLKNTGLGKLLTRMGLATVFVTIVIFLLAPRFGRSPWQTGTLEPTRIVGYSEEVTLGDLGESVENPETVMRVHLVDEETEGSIRLANSPLFRGTVVTRYDLKKHRWSQRDEGFGPGVRDLAELPESKKDLVRQEITLEPLTESAVFSIFPVYAQGAHRSLIKFDENTRQLFRPELYKDQQVKFNLWTTGIHDYLQNQVVPAGNGLSQNEIEYLKRLPSGEGGVDPFVGLKQVTDQALADAGVNPDDPYAVAEALEAFMMHQGDFRYSIEAQPPPAPGVDPIEHFVTNSRIGHCEYFASALTMMLRYKGIPARVVIGFKGGDWNSLGRYYQVRQLHAHAWVEAFMKRSQLEPHGFTFGSNDFAGWVTLDSTADTMAATAQQGDGFFSQIRSTLDFVQMQWITYVVGLSREQQQEHIYQPLSDLYKAMENQIGFSSLMNNNGQPSVLTIIEQLLLSLAGGNWFSWRGFVVACCLLMFSALLLLGGWYVGRFAWRKLRRYWLSATLGPGAAGRATIPFYEQLEALLAKHGYQRTRVQTQREFAASTGSLLEQSPERAAAAQLPQAVVEAYYAVRFGGRTLDAQQTQAVEQALTELNDALSAPVVTHGSAPPQSNGV